MARVVLGNVTGGIQFDSFDTTALLDYEHIAAHKTSAKMYDDKQNFFEISGKNLDVQTVGGSLYDVNGTINSATWEVDGKPAFTATGLHADAHMLFEATVTGDVDTFAKLVFSGNDTIIGTKFADTLWGEDGKDVLIGGRGADNLFGDAGADTFTFKSAKDSTNNVNGQDTIHDFTSKDMIDLTKIDADADKHGNNAFKFIGTHAFDGHGAAGELRYEATATDTYVYGDVNGDGNADFTIHLTGDIALGKGDFHL